MLFRVTFFNSRSFLCMLTDNRHDSLGLLTDNAIMLKVKDGHLDGMRLLFERYHKPLYGFLYRMTGERETSEDIVQDVFLRMLRSRHTFTVHGEFKTWMYHVARNLLKDTFKRNQKTGGHYDITAFEERISSGEMADAKVQQQEEAALLQRALSKLEPLHREILVLSRYQELRYSEIAAILDITEGAVKVRVHRAMEQLRAIFLKLNAKTEY